MTIAMLADFSGRFMAVDETGLVLAINLKMGVMYGEVVR
jgi:hypothetical protein